MKLPHLLEKIYQSHLYKEIHTQTYNKNTVIQRQDSFKSNKRKKNVMIRKKTPSWKITSEFLIRRNSENITSRQHIQSAKWRKKKKEK